MATPTYLSSSSASSPSVPASSPSLPPITLSPLAPSISTPNISNTVTFRSPDQKMHEIVPSLFLGSMFAAQDKDLLLSHNITHILQVAEELSPRYPSVFAYKVVEACDMEEYPIDQHFEECIDFVRHVITVKKQNILVHCLGGISRSTSIVVAYLMKEHNLSYEEALETVTRKRIFANPNKGFKKLLQQYGEYNRQSRDLFSYTHNSNTNNNNNTTYITNPDTN